MLSTRSSLHNRSELHIRDSKQRREKVLLWDSDIFRHTYNFWGFKILNFNIYIYIYIYIYIFFFFFFWGGGGCSKNDFWGGYEDFLDIFGGSSQNWTGFMGHFCVFNGLFLRLMYRTGIYIFWGC